MKGVTAIGRRAVREGDRAFLLALYGSCRADEMAAWGWSEEQWAVFINMQYSARCCQYDAVFPGRDDSIILLGGVSAGLLSIYRGETALNLVDIALLPDHRGSGVGSRLLRELQREATESGKPLRLHVLAENTAASRFYQQLGFECQEEGVHRLLEWRPNMA